MANKALYKQSYGFSSSHVWMWELDHKKVWVLKNWCFRTVVLEKTLESPLDSKECKLVNPKRNKPWIFIGRTDAKASKLWPPDVKSQLLGKDPDFGKGWGQERWVTEDEMVWWHHRLNGPEFEQTPVESEGQGSSFTLLFHLQCTAVHGVAKSQTQLSHWTTNTTDYVSIVGPAYVVSNGNKLRAELCLRTIYGTLWFPPVTEYEGLWAQEKSSSK